MYITLSQPCTADLFYNNNNNDTQAVSDYIYYVHDTQVVSDYIRYVHGTQAVSNYILLLHNTKFSMRLIPGLH